MGRAKDHNILARRFILTERDELAFCRALREVFPTIRFIEERPYRNAEMPISPDIPSARWNCLYGVVPEQSDWQPLMFLRPGDRYWPINFPRRTFTIRRSHWEWPRPAHWLADPPFLMQGEAYRSVKKEGEEDLRAFINEVFRCLNRVSRGGAGYDALRWASESPLRALNGCSFVPSNFQFPAKNRYYQDELWDDRLPEAPTLQTRGRPYDVEAFKRGEPV